MLDDILANFTNDSELNAWATELVKDLGNLRKHDSPFTAENVSSTGASAMTMSSMYMKLKQRKPMVIEYFEKVSDVKPKSITLYINPERLQITNQKVIKKQFTRGGIFYHHYGADHSNMILLGTTGMSGMAGIKQLEEVYYASSTLLRYNNFLPTQMYQNIDNFKIIDYADPLMAATAAMKNNMSKEEVTQVQSNILSKVNDKNTFPENNEKLNAAQVLENYKKTMGSFGDNLLPEGKIADMHLTDREDCLFRTFYDDILERLAKKYPNKHPSTLIQLAYETTVKRILKDRPEDINKYIDNTYRDPELEEFNCDALNQLYDFEAAQKFALKKHIQNLNKFKEREMYIKDLMETHAVTLNEEMKDEWLPRQIMIYFDSRIYTGHFNSFNYSRDAKTNLINYELRFTITKEFQFNNFADPNKNDLQVEIKTEEKKPEPAPVPKPKPAPPKPAPKDDNLYTVQPGDTLGKIAIKFFGKDRYWSNIYAANLNTVKAAYYKPKPKTYADIYPGQKLVIPKNVPSGYRVWVVLQGDTLRYLAQRYYGNGNKWRRIYDANRNVISNPEMIHPKMVIKIPN